ncbi:MAG: hypothetical protein ISR01_02200 [Chitinophagales bacterium]|nr:hypothetical protein [Chitinophagales bacterium]
MLQYDNKNWFSFIFRHGSKHVDGMWWSMLFMGLLTSALIYVNEHTAWLHFEISTTFHTVLGLVLGLLLVFRTNSAYDRWWEGRKQLGALVNTTRNLALKVKTYAQGANPSLSEETLTLIYAFAFSMKEHLREEDFSSIFQEIPAAFLSDFKKFNHKPNFVLGKIAKNLHQLFSEGTINGEQLIILEKEANALINILGACERIKNTPIPMAYALHLKRVLLIYALTLPFGFVGQLGWVAIPMVLIVFYTMVGIELIGEEIEDPFGLDENDLPVNELCNKIKANILEISKY